MVGVTLFGLTASGKSWLDNGKYTDWNCKYLFTSRELAEAEVPAFTKRVCEPTDDNLDALQEGTILVHIFEYEVKS